MSKEPYRKISIQVPEELYERLQKNFEWGERNRVLNKVLVWVCDKVERHGSNALIILLREDEFEALLQMRKSQNGNNS